LRARKFGDSLGIVLPKEAVNRLQTAKGESLFLVEARGREYRLTPCDPKSEKKTARADDIIKRYRNTLHVFAE
jgi:antitoxin component of MazEF toxin-antitoxin module